MSKALCTGSFDPATNGHINVFERAAAQFDELVVTVMVNTNKKTMFTIDERIEMLREATAHIGNVRVASWQGLLVDFAREQGITAIVKGLRCGDFDYELPMARTHHTLTVVDTCFITSDPTYGFLSSSLAKEVATSGGDITDLLPVGAHGRLLKRLAEG
ncbi:pantetheine-phosphate adenylyltransferase [Nocardia uniformis]|uniref:Phosphopantetheine adenylyltransferase n=1 Tax=Nocardia uniformis TaxID=53432 RepID=A0A849C6C8_9NOCA|nr:pantetheine-phosphate adenylyltransferase [Nocardia uniformis]NNH71387.1 pantetheine-phosphate adenylyltransferase [Nocardia uniformis]